MEKEKTTNPKSKLYGRIALITLAVIALVIGFFKYREAQLFETTDDAQLETDISPVAPRISGYIANVNFADNQQVKKGDTIVTMDDHDLLIKVSQAEAALQNAAASLALAKANRFTTEQGSQTTVFKVDEIAIRIANANKEVERYKKMFSEGSATQQQLEKIQTEKDALEKQLSGASQQQKESSSRINSSAEQVKIAESVVQQRQSEVDFAKLQLSYAYITAPFDGIVSKKNALSGQLMQAGQPVCSIVAAQNIWVVANFKETQVGKMKTGMTVEIKVDALPDTKIKGKVASFSSATGSKFSLIPADNATGNFVKVVQRIPVKVELDKNSEAVKELKPGMSVSVKVRL